MWLISEEVNLFGVRNSYFLARSISISTKLHHSEYCDELSGSYLIAVRWPSFGVIVVADRKYSVMIDIP